MEALAGEGFEGVLVVGEEVDFPVHAPDFLLQALDLALLGTAFEAGADPGDDPVAVDEEDHEDERRRDDGEFGEGVVGAAPERMLFFLLVGHFRGIGSLFSANLVNLRGFPEKT